MPKVKKIFFPAFNLILLICIAVNNFYELEVDYFFLFIGIFLNGFTFLRYVFISPQNLSKNSSQVLLSEQNMIMNELDKEISRRRDLEKFNRNYRKLLPEQKNILREFITSVNSTTRLRNVVNEELSNLQKEVNSLLAKVKDEVVKIKLEEVLKSIKPLSNKDKIKDSHLVNLMQYYDLVNELRSL